MTHTQHCDRDNLPLPVQMQFSENRKTFRCLFIAFLKSASNLYHFEPKGFS